MMNSAKSDIDFNVSEIYPYISKGAKLVGIEPSCILGFVSDFPDLASNKDNAYEISKNTMLIEEFLLHHLETKGEIKFTNPPDNKEALFHGHCHQKALVGTSPAMKLLKKIPGLTTSEINSGCCGMAGSFGFDKDHFDISMDIGEMTLFPKIRKESEDVMIISEGVSCRQQIQEGTKRDSKHVVQVIADYL